MIDGFDWFNQLGGPLTNYVGQFWFGGGHCPERPYASFVLNLYGVMGAPACPRIDYNHDGLIDFADYLEFLNAYDISQSAADINGDGLVDFADYLEFLTLYDTCGG
ncbi:MAG: EF-hand domain-containing protein [Phycisphaerales bacterium]|nr:EF-hand domain-containing protein [Phycisphaerales bacterium]